MSTLLLRLVGPMQSWGTTSRLIIEIQVKSQANPEYSVCWLLHLALTVKTGKDLKPFTQLSMAVRHDRPGVLKSDYQTAGCAINDTVMKADGTQSKDGVVSMRYYLADACFLVGLEGDRCLLEAIHIALENPAWPLCLGRKSYIPSEMVWIQDGVVERAH